MKIQFLDMKSNVFGMNILLMYCTFYRTFVFFHSCLASQHWPPVDSSSYSADLFM